MNYYLLYIQDTNHDYNNSNQLSNYQANYSLFTNIHYIQSTDLNKTCETNLLAAPRQRR
jgi:hypothetical protein